MPSSPPFVDPESGALDTDHIWIEAEPLAKLIALFGIPSAMLQYIGADFYGLFGATFTVVGQFVFYLGAAIVVLYAVARGRQLSESVPESRGSSSDPQ
ncbi:hypothetical protein [Halapricum hydrolyticum]|uniref:Uncharacterized protein n=1 Tax=Halapricum hydrolyticum TaxID=2979991 RepID=A0AAE3IDU8_9EURY|nr:hypothetical protein [Halapricum hydrolyticum]MCU4719530.1 hypothetical protein [Halapricum hydrolyticum]MCU4728186.1 hypothetical protein [Halapricum hydrolyticum]